MTYPLGQRLVAVWSPYRHRDPPRLQDILVTKVGRKWATFVDAAKPDLSHLGGRFDLETWILDAGDSMHSGRVHRNRQDYERQAALDGRYKAARLALSHSRPDWVTEDLVRSLERTAWKRGKPVDESGPEDLSPAKNGGAS